MMWKSTRFSHVIARFSQLQFIDAPAMRACFCQLATPSSHLDSSQSQPPQTVSHPPENRATEIPRNYIGRNVSRKEKNEYLLTTLLDLNDSKEAIYGALDAWVAWEQNFPIASLKLILNSLEKQQQWHRVVQVIKWILSKGQGNTMGTYGQLIRALDMDHRVEEAHKFWEMKIGSDLHSVPWQLCHLMISVYYRNNMLEDLVRLFKGLEAFDRKPRDKLIIQKVANAYEMLGLHQEKDRVLKKYNHLFTDEGSTKKPRKNSDEAKKTISLLTEKGRHKECEKASPD